MTDSTEVYNFTVATGHDAKLKPEVENGLTHDWSIYVKGAQGTRLFRCSKVGCIFPVFIFSIPAWGRIGTTAIGKTHSTFFTKV